MKYDSGMIVDNTGKKYDGAFYGTHKDQDNWVSYDITDCGFTKFSGTEVKMDGEMVVVMKESDIIAIIED